MDLLYRILRVGDVDDEGPVRLHYAALQRIGRTAAVRTHEQHRSSVRILDHVRLVGTAPLQVGVAQALHVFLLTALTDRQRTARAESDNGGGDGDRCPPRTAIRTRRRQRCAQRMPLPNA